jgi:alkylhydroperoxidase/carboxymuconolactone decarboxylase family protein YurZ
LVPIRVRPLEGDPVPETSETPILDLLASMTANSLEATTLDAETSMLVRIAALVAVDAPPASYLLNLGAASELEIDVDQIRGVLTAVAPIVGTARIASATGKIMQALALELEVAEIEAELGERA